MSGRLVRFFLVFGALCLALAGSAWLLGVRFTLTPSIPIGFYRYTGEEPAPGRLAIFCPPAHIASPALVRGYLHRGRCPGGVEPLGKYVLAVAGDSVHLTPDGIFVNGRRLEGSAVLHRDSRGRKLPYYPFGEYVVGADSLFMFSGHHPRSFDSRYYGPVPRSNVISTARPLWIFD
jgi:conjugative transfer signal peptidase TraF